MKIHQITRYLVALLMVFGGLFLIGCMSQQVTLTFSTNGGTRITAMTVTQGEVIESIPDAVRTGYTFEGWFLESDLINPFDPSLPLMRHMTIYAKWSINQYTLSFDTGTDDVVPAITTNYNEVLSALPTPTRVGHTFDGWYLEPEFTNEFSATRMPAGSLTLYAKWIPFEYDVTFHRLDGTVLRVETVSYGQTLTTIPNVPFVTGKDGSWDVSDFTNITEDIDVHPLYEWKIYTVTFVDLDDPSFEVIQHIQHGDYASPLSPTPSKVGYDFLHYSVVLSETQITSNTTIILVFDPITFQVIFFDELGSPISSDTIVWGQDATPPSYDPPIGYNFIGWSESYNNVIDDLNITPILEIFQYSIVLYALEGEFGSGLNTLTITTDYDDSVGVPETPTRDGYHFGGWYLNDSFTGDPYIFSPLSTMPFEGLTLYAHWVAKTHATVSGEFIFEREIITDYQTLTGTFESDGPNVPFSVTGILFGTMHSPVVTFEGYEFVKFVYNGVEYFNIIDLIQVDADIENIQVYYARRVLSINFFQVPSEGGSPEDPVDETFYVLYNMSFPGPNPTLFYVSPYTAIWDRTLFNKVRANIEVRAIYYESGLQTITFIDEGAVKYLAVNIPPSLEKPAGTPNQILTEASLLWNLTQPGRRFVGWFTAPTGGTQLAIEDMYFSIFASSATIYAQWIDLDAFDVPTAIDIVVYETDAFTISWTLDPATIELAPPIGFNIDLNGFIIFVDIANITVDGTRFTLNVLPSNDIHSLFASMFAPGVHTISIQALGDDENHTDGDYSAIATFAVDTEIEGDITGSVVYDYFIVEDIMIAGTPTKRYVFYANMTYNFPTRYHFVITSGQEHITANNNSLSTTNIVGNFAFSITDNIDPANPVTYHYEGRVVANINQFALGSDLSTYLEETTGDNYLSPIITDYLVGYRNNFYFNLRVRDNNGVRIALDNVMMVYEFYLDGATEALTDGELADYVSFVEGNIMKFTSLAEGHSFRVVMKPRYQSLQMQVDDLEFEITINDAHNVFTNTELRTLFANFNVRTLNIHTNIEASLAASQKNADGSPKNIAGNPATGNINGNVYGRASNSISGDHLVINGNYMTINGSNLPFSNRDSGSGVLGYSAAFEVINVQIAIFYYQVFNASTMPAWVNTTEISQTDYVNDNRFTVNNLTVLSNTTTPSINYGMSAEEIASQEQLMSRNSGGYNGLMVRGGSSEFNNVIVGYALLPYFNTAFGSASATEVVPVYMVLNYNKAYDSWANSVYMWGATGVVINNSYIGQSGGAAIHAVDTRRAGGVYNPTVLIDGNTVIDNWISGDEAWFRAYAMSVVALQLKAGVEDAVNGIGKTIIKEIINPVTGLPSEMINLIMLTEPGSGSTSYDALENPITGPEYSIMLTDTIGPTLLENPFNILTYDPRVQDNTFIFAVGQLSSTASFMAAVTELMSPPYNIPQAQAIQIAYIAGFYNLSVYDAMNVAGIADAMTWPIPQAVDYWMWETYNITNHPRPGYLEVITQVPIFNGNSTVIIEFFDQE